MMTPEEDMDAHALRRQGWTIAAIARHLGRDRKTIRAYLSGQRQPGVRLPADDDPFDAVADYLGQRLADDPHVLATALFDEAQGLGYPRAYSTFTRQIRDRRLRPVCPACAAGTSEVPTTEIDHPAGEETQWDWVELPEAPWLDGGSAMVLVGSLAHSSKTRGVFCDETDQAHTFDGIDRVAARLGGVTRRWRFDRMATVVAVGSDRVLPSFAAFAKHYGVGVDICPPRRGQRKGVVEKNIDFLTRRWWRTADVATAEQAQASLDRFCATIGDARPRHDLEGRPSTVGALADAERLMALPATRYPATMEVIRKVAANATVAYRGNHYSVDPSLVGIDVVVRISAAKHEIDIIDLATGLLARHRLVAPGQGAVVRDGAHAVALEAAVLAAFTTNTPCRRKANRPPSDKAKKLAAAITDPAGAGRPGDTVLIDLARWAQAAPEASR
jgi:transposase